MKRERVRIKIKEPRPDRVSMTISFDLPIQKKQSKKNLVKK